MEPINYVAKTKEELIAICRAKDDEIADLERRLGERLDERCIFVSRDGEHTLVVDAYAGRVTLDNKAVHLTTKELAMLRAFVTYPERLWDRAELGRYIHSDGAYLRVVDSHLKNLRIKLNDSVRRNGGVDESNWIECEHGKGYRFVGTLAVV